ncbi:hypothetical protein ABW19_dt0200830 [Dactylella cylindrospora]|nr:hypothetical protein ABW19_dt0200830 [Dactylella cylindrospora]
MSTLNITLNPLAVDRLYEALTCLSKFGEYVTIDARRNKASLQKILVEPEDVELDPFGCRPYLHSRRYVLRLLQLCPGSEEIGFDVFERRESKFREALLPVFRGRYVQEAVNKERDDSLVQGIEKCEISLHERPSKVQCRLVVRMFCRHGVLKTYRLQYEESDIVYAAFKKEWSVHKWTMRATELKKWMEHFGPKAEHLDIAYDTEDRVSFTSYTEKIVDGAQILKHPLQTAIEIDKLEFNEFLVQQDTHIAVSVKDFKAIVLHAGALEQVQISAAYGDPGQPMQVTYDQGGMFCEFTLMTRKKGAAGPAGTGKAEPVAKIVINRQPGASASGSGTAPGTREGSVVPIKAQPLSSAPALRKGSATPGPTAPTPVAPVAPISVRGSSRPASTSMEMPPPPSRITPRVGSVPAPSNQSRESPISARQPSMSLRGSAPPPRQSQSLFLMDESDDDLFGPGAGGVDEQLDDMGLDDEDVLGWDASLGSENVSFVELQERAVNDSANDGNKGKKKEDEGSFVAPTQRANVVKGLFDD